MVAVQVGHVVDDEVAAGVAAELDPRVLVVVADVVLDGGIGGFITTDIAFFLDTKYIKYRPHAQRNFVPLNPNQRYSVNQDAAVQIMAWAGNLTSCGLQYQGKFKE